MNHTHLKSRAQSQAPTLYLSGARLIAANFLLILAMSACSDGDHSSALVAGTVNGLSSGTSVVLQNNGGDDFTVTTDGPFTFPIPVAIGSTYEVTVLSQPAGQQCTVVSGEGPMGAAPINVAVNCVALPDSWNWVGGSNIAGSSGVYGTLNVGAPGNIPGARYGSVSWTDSSGNFWLFGGIGYDSAGVTGSLNDLWEYSAGLWIWRGGSDTISASGTYGTKGLAAADNIPGARFAAVTSLDSSGNVWLHGGQGRDSAGTEGLLNDLWVYTNGQWTWVSGTETVNATGTYGTQGSAAAGNVPGARFAGNSWIDSSGDLWLFGGMGFDSTGAQGFQNDLWKYSGGQWTWVSGASTVQASGTYGTEGVAAAGNVPGARLRPVSWVDSAGDLWVFGGLGIDSVGAQGGLNDLWRYSAGQWTWMGGSNAINAAGTYGTKGVAAADNVPGARLAAISWLDSSGDVWLSGGQVADPMGNEVFLNDLWVYSAGQWKWVSGSDTANVSGSYGIQGTAAIDNVPGSRYAAISWLDASDQLWMFGGIGYDAAGTNGGLNDLWEYVP